MSSPKDSVFPETIPEEASSVEEERVVIFRLPSSGAHLIDNSFYTVCGIFLLYIGLLITILHFQADASLLQQQSISRRGSNRSLNNKEKEKFDKSTSKFDFDRIDQFDKNGDKKFDEGKPKTSSSTERESLETDSKSPPYVKGDVTAATFLDIAVLRCLFISHWQEDGVYWSFHYIFNR